MYDKYKTRGQIEDYMFLKQANKFCPKKITNPPDQLLLPDISATPGSWIYRNYSEKRLKTIQILYIMSITLRILAFLLGEVFSNYNFTEFDIATYDSHHIYGLIGWGTVFILEIFFIVYIIKPENLSTSMVAESLGYTIFVVYALEIVYLPVRNKSIFAILVMKTIISIVLSAVLYYIYKRMKTRFSQNFMVAPIEYIGIHLKVSVQLAWVFCNFFHHIFQFFSQVNGSPEDRQTLLGWPVSNWAILIICLFCAIGVIFLASYKDIYVTIILAYGLFSICYLDAFNRVCRGPYKENCLDQIQDACIILGSILLFLSLVVLVLYRRMVCNLKC